MRRLTIKGFKTAGFLLKAAASGIESLLEETYPVLREGAKRIGLSPKDFTHIEISNKAFNEATSIKRHLSILQDHVYCRSHRWIPVPDPYRLEENR